jgi:hypothetical protein
MLDTFNFLTNKYTKWYFNIVSNAQNRNISGYTEKHHIIPKSLGGNNTQINLVKLTAREHFICHWLLTKMVHETKHQYQMWNAFSCMLYRKRPDQDRYKINSKKFEGIKRVGSEIKSKLWSGEGNPMYGLRGKSHPAYGKKWTDEHRKNASISHQGQIRSIESRQKQSEKTKGRKQSDDHIAKRARSGEQNHMYGKKQKPESIAKMLATRERKRLLKLAEGSMSCLG